MLIKAPAEIREMKLQETFFEGDGEADDLCLPVFLKDFVVVIKVKHRIAEIVIDSIFVTRVTEPIPAPSDTLPTKQNIYDSSLLFAERRLFKSLVHLVPAQSCSLPQFYGDILLVNYFTKLWREAINGLRNDGCHLGVYTTAYKSSNVL